MTLLDRWDFPRGLSSQFPAPRYRVVYGKSGTLPAAAIISDDQAAIDQQLYWAGMETMEEAQYLSALLNSETARQRVEHLQATGQWGARHFDKLLLSLPIPQFARRPLHNRLAKAAERAEAVAANVVIPDNMYFVTARGRIREALREDGVAAEIDGLVAELLGPA